MSKADPVSCLVTPVRGQTTDPRDCQYEKQGLHAGSLLDTSRTEGQILRVSGQHTPSQEPGHLYPLNQLIYCIAIGRG